MHAKEMKMNAVRVLLADDHALVRAGIRLLLNEIDNVEVVAEASDGREALALAEAHRPDVVLMDISMRQMDGLEATEQLHRALPEIRVLMLSMHQGRDYVTRALRAGACGYLLKHAAAHEVGLAIAAVMRGDAYLSPAVSKSLVDSYVRTPHGEQAELALTARQQEVLGFVAQGHSTKEIAYHLGLSVKTVEAHRTQLKERLKIRDVAGLVCYAIRIGLLKVDPQTGLA
jgi:DNA-binding NarL/FixJ family response regulator